MSYDLKLYRKCDHRLLKQQREVSGVDRRSVLLRHVMGSQANVRVFVNGFEVFQNDDLYGWSIVKEEGAVPVTTTQQRFITGSDGCIDSVVNVGIDQTPRKILFNRIFRATDDCIEISYFALPVSCPKCNGIGVHFDYEYSNIGRLVRVVNEQKLIQDMEKIILTIIGSSIFYPWYGTSLVDLIGGKGLGATTQAQISAEISQGLVNLKKLQEQQELYQVVTDREFLFSILSIQVEQSQQDPTVFRVNVVTQSQAGSEQSFSQDLRFDRGLFTTPLDEIRRITL